MGGAASKSQFQRSKSLSTFGRSSQKGLFQKTKAKLKQIDKKLQTEKENPNREEIKKQLEDVEKELNEVSATVKNKNKTKYEEVLKYFNEVCEKFGKEGILIQRNKIEPKNNNEEPEAHQGDTEGPKMGANLRVLPKITFGRSSQRGLFQNSKAKLNEINKNLETFAEEDLGKYASIGKELNEIENELNVISTGLKDKNRKHYEEVIKCLEETREKFESKVKPVEKPQKEPEVLEKPVPQMVEIKLVKVIGSIENLDEEVEIRKPIEQTEEEISFRKSEPSSPKVKFGVQVMPTNPRVSQDLLKRNTLPINEGPKAEFEKMRIKSDSAAMNVQSSSAKEFPSLLNEATGSASFQGERKSLPPQKPPRLLQENSVEEDALQKIEAIGHVIDELEKKLKYFNGTKEDKGYIELHERFINSLINLDNIETDGDPVVKQERKITVQRVQELMTILERLVEEPEEILNSFDTEAESISYNPTYEDRGKKDNAEPKPITATPL